MSHKTIKNDERCTTGVEGLDSILGGGLPCGCLYLVQGDPGSGKTTFAMQFLLEGLRQGEKVFYVTLSETKDELERVARSHDWSLAEIPLLELSAIESLVRPEAQTTVFHPSELELAKVSKLLLEETRRTKPSRVVFDSLSEFRLMAETPLRYRRQLLTLKQEFAKHGSTVLLLDDKMENEEIGSDPHVLSLTHGVIEMEQLSPDYGMSRRRMRVVKMRGVGFREGHHDYLIAKGGLRIFPRLVAAQHRGASVEGSVSSGVKELDEVLGGGLDRGTTTLVLGPAGAGKSTLSLHYISELANKGERGMVFTFDEIRGVMLARSKAFGLDLEPHLKSGVVTVQQVDPAELSPGEFTDRILKGVEAGARIVVIDSLNGYLNAMPGEQYLNIQLHELSAYLNQQGIVTILIMAQHGLLGPGQAPVDLSYLADTVVSLRFFEVAGEIRQAVAVVKKRSGWHEKTIREFKMDSGRGIRIGAPLTGVQSLLSGVPTFSGNPAQLLKAADAG